MNTSNRKTLLSEDEKKQAFERAKNTIVENNIGDAYGDGSPSALKRRLMTNSRKLARETYYKGDLTELYYKMDSMSVDEYLDVVYNVKDKNDADE